VPRELPIVGLYIPVTFKTVEEIPEDARHRLYVTRGIGGPGDDDDPAMVNWCSFYKAHLKNTQIPVRRIPYRYGGIFDAVFAQLNFSQGAAYDMAARIKADLEKGANGQRPGQQGDERLWLTGHSAGVQRMLVAARILKSQCGVETDRRLGIAGPSHGLYSAKTSQRSDQITFLNGDFFESDFVTWVDLALIACDPFSWVFRENRAYLTQADKSLLHRTPGSIDPVSRIPAAGYLRGESISFFRSQDSGSGQDSCSGTVATTKEDGGSK